MKYDAITEILANLRIEKDNIKNKEFYKNIEFITKKLNFELGNIKKKNYDNYEKKIIINNKPQIITIIKLTENNQIEIVYRQNSNSINLKLDNDKVYLSNLSIMYPHGFFILDNQKKNIYYYDKDTIEYVREKQKKAKDSHFISQNDMEENGLIPDEIIYLPDNNIEQIELFKKLITNTKEENEILLGEMKKSKGKTKILIKNI